MTFSTAETPNQKRSESPVAIPKVKRRSLNRIQCFYLESMVHAEKSIDVGGVCAKGFTAQALPQGSSAGKEELLGLSKDPPPPSSRLEHVDPPCSPTSASHPLKRAREGPSDGNGLGLEKTKTANADHFDHLVNQNLKKSFENAVLGVENAMLDVQDAALGMNNFSENLIRHMRTLEQEVSRLVAVEMKSKEEISLLKQDLNSMTAVEMKSKEEISRLKQDLNSMIIARDHWMGKFLNEASTGTEFHQSKAGQKLLEEIKSGHLDEFKKSLAFKTLVADEAADIFDRTVEECRKKLKEKGQILDQDSF